MSFACLPWSDFQIDHRKKDPITEPILTTERLILRPFQAEDILWFSLLLGHPEVMYFSPKGPLQYEEAQEFLDSNIESFRLRKFGLMACYLRDVFPNQPIGFCGVSLREIDGVLYPELGYRFFPEAWGKGYATEAAIAVRDDVFSRLELPEVVSFIDPKNLRSIRVATKIGEEFGFHATYKGIEIAVYRLSKTFLSKHSLQ